jgi:hypothetical protein
VSDPNIPQPEIPNVVIYPSWEEICYPDGRTPWSDDPPPITPATSTPLYEDPFGPHFDLVEPEVAEGVELPEGMLFFGISGQVFGLTRQDVSEVLRVFRLQYNRAVCIAFTLDEPLTLVVEQTGRDIELDLHQSPEPAPRRSSRPAAQDE